MDPVLVALLGRVAEKLLAMYADGKTRDAIDPAALMSRREHLQLANLAKIEAARRAAEARH